MRVYVLISDDVIFKPRVIYKLLLELGNKAVGVAVIKYSTQTKSKKVTVTERDIWGFKGLVEIGCYSTLLRIANFLPIPKFLKSKLNIKNICDFFSVPFMIVDDVNSSTFESDLQKYSIDVLVSLQRQILGENILNIPSITCINCHPADLPKYRGLNPVFSAMNNAETEIGVTAHSMTVEIDKGRILAKKKFTIRQEFTLMDNYFLAHEYYADVIIDAINNIVNNGLDSFPYIPDDAPYYPFPDLKMLKEFRAKGRLTI